MPKQRIFEPGRLEDRNDPKWSHPALAGDYTIDGRTTVYQLTDQDVPLEERIAIRDSTYKYIEKTHKKMVEANPDWGPAENTKIFEVPGCEEEPDTPNKVMVRYPAKPRRKSSPTRPASCFTAWAAPCALPCRTPLPSGAMRSATVAPW
ncbi:MAG: hypothetical protein IJH08_02515 [Atopobiaceae bacterium]|nr:hypothetical protein [Atopobiaceae bacterium]